MQQPPTSQNAWGHDQPYTTQPGMPMNNQSNNVAEMYAEMYGASPMAMGAVPDVWMPPVNCPIDCPPGLEYLTQLEGLRVMQKVDMAEIMTGWERNNKYKIYNHQGQQCYFAYEKSNTCCRQCCGPNRGFTMTILDRTDKPVFKIKRSYKCFAGASCFACSSCCQDEVKVETVDGERLGSVHQSWSCCNPEWKILDGKGKTQFKMEGPCCTCMPEMDFPVKSAKSGEVVATISKEWRGAVLEIATTANSFGIKFPKDMEVRMKATLIAAVFLIDFMFFERNRRRRR